jgi:hypothetical protein
LGLSPSSVRSPYAHAPGCQNPWGEDDVGDLEIDFDDSGCDSEDDGSTSAALDTPCTRDTSDTPDTKPEEHVVQHHDAHTTAVRKHVVEEKASIGGGFLDEEVDDAWRVLSAHGPTLF